MVRYGTGPPACVAMRSLATVAAALLLSACSATAPPATSLPSAADRPSPAPSSTGTPVSPPDLAPPAGTAWFGMNLDWANDSIAAVSGRLGVTPSVWVQFVAFPLDDAGRANLDSFAEQVSAVNGIGLVTLEPHDGLAAVSPAAAEELATILDRYWVSHGTPTIVRFAHEMNGSWYPWGQQPEAYVDAFRTVADAVHDLAPASAMAWAPNEGSGYPFTGGPYASADEALDTDGDGTISNADDPYGPYWPGADSVDWVGMSLYHWGHEYPWGENEIPADDSFVALLTGRNTGARDGQVGVPNFYAEYAEANQLPMGVFETAALYNPNAEGPAEADIKSAWWAQVTDTSLREKFPRLAMLNWFEWRKGEPEVDGVIDWRMAADPALARRLLTDTPAGWLRFGGIEAP